MKKVLALVLAVVLAFGMTTVAFAAVAKNDYSVNSSFSFATGYYSDDGKVDMGDSFTSGGDLVPGKTLYFPITASKYDGTAWKDSGVTKLSDLNDYRISYSVDDGKNMIKSVKFVSMSIKSGSTKGLFVAVETNDNFIMEEAALAFTAAISAKNGSTFDKTDVDQNTKLENLSFSANMTYKTPDSVGNGYHTVDGAEVISFDDDADDVTLCFDEDVEVAGNMKGQKDVLVRMKTSNDALEDRYPDATLRLFDSTKDTFRRDVTVTLPYESSVEKPYLYVVDAKGTLTKLYGGSNADKAADETKVTYDDVAGAFTFTTKTLNNYIISDTELKSTTSTPSTDVDAPVEGDKPTDGTQPNPGTGANDFVGLAVAMAVVSVAGIAVAKRK